MIEVLVSAVLVAIMAVAFFGALNGSERVSGVGKLRAESAALAQDDQERMRSMPVTALNNLLQSNTRTVAGINFTVESRADWIADQAKAATCTTNGGKADYLKITSTVTPATASSLRPVAITSTVTPAPGSFSGKGSLAVTVVDRNAVGVAGVPVNVTGPANATAFTDATGCAFFGYLPAGTTYQVGPAKGGYVDEDGNPTPKVGITINDQQVATQGFTYDLAGAASVTFYSKPTNAAGASLGVDVNTNQWKLVVFNASHTPRTFGTAYPTSVPPAGSNPFTSTGYAGVFNASPLFPFTSAYGLYAGEEACSNNSPASNSVVDPGLLVPPGDNSLTYKQRIPALNVYGTVGSSPAVATPNLRVKITSVTPGCGGWSIVRKTNAAGLLDDPGVPFGTYNVCADNSPIVGTSSAKKSFSNGVAATSLTGAQVALAITTASGTC
jgi:Tfp pilus assembly protein PilV